jgi:hypothetical protein
VTIVADASTGVLVRLNNNHSWDPYLATKTPTIRKIMFVVPALLQRQSVAKSIMKWFTVSSNFLHHQVARSERTRDRQIPGIWNHPLYLAILIIFTSQTYLVKSRNVCFELTALIPDLRNHLRYPTIFIITSSQRFQ